MGCVNSVEKKQASLPKHATNTTTQDRIKQSIQQPMRELCYKSTAQKNSVRNVIEQRELYTKLFLHLNKEKWSFESINTTCEIIFEIYKNQSSSIVFVFLAFQIVISYMEKRSDNKLHNSQVQKMFQLKIEELSKIYPPTVNQPVEGANQIENYTAPEQPDLFQKYDYTDSQGFYQSIRDLLEQAHKQFEPFQKYAQPIMEEKGHGSKFGQKNSGNNTAKEKAFARILAKCLKNHFEIAHFKQSLNPMWDWREYEKMLPQERQAAIKRSLKSNNKIPFKVYDLVRCKSHYDSVADIVYTVNRLKQQAVKSGYEILKVDNRLNKGTRDVNLNLKAGNIVAQMQLGLDFDEKGNQFNHKLYEIAREPFGVIMGCCELISYTDIENLGATLLVTITNPSSQLLQAWVSVNIRIHQLIQTVPTINSTQDILGKQFTTGLSDMKSGAQNTVASLGKF